MSTAALRQQLERLVQELARADKLDAGSREALKGVVAEMERVIAAAEPDHGTLRERIENTALGFEAEHPRLSAVLGEVTDTLAKMGI